MIPRQLVKQFIKNAFTDNVEGHINKLEEAYNYFMENLPAGNQSAAILHQLLDVIEELEILCMKELKINKNKCYKYDMHNNF